MDVELSQEDLIELVVARLVKDRNFVRAVGGRTKAELHAAAAQQMSAAGSWTYEERQQLLERVAALYADRLRLEYDVKERVKTCIDGLMKQEVRTAVHTLVSGELGDYFRRICRSVAGRVQTDLDAAFEKAGGAE